MTGIVHDAGPVVVSVLEGENAVALTTVKSRVPPTQRRGRRHHSYVILQPALTKMRYMVQIQPHLPPAKSATSLTITKVLRALIAAYRHKKTALNSPFFMHDLI